MKTSFSKGLLAVDYTILVVMIVAFVELSGHGCDMSSFAVIISAWITQIAVSSGFYYWKAKAENVVKLPIYMLKELPEDMKEKADPNQIISSVVGIGHN